jgi:hypothetical protein
MNNPGVQEEIWIALRQKWSTLVAEGHSVEVKINVIKDPQNEAKALAIDVVQKIDNEWYVQTVQSKIQEAYSAIGIEGVRLNQLIDIASRVIDSVTKPVIGCETFDDEMHIFMRHISPMTSELHGYVISKIGERIEVRTNYQHYYVINEILNQISEIMNEEYTEIQLHRNKDDDGRIYIKFIHA